MVYDPEAHARRAAQGLYPLSDDRRPLGRPCEVCHDVDGVRETCDDCGHTGYSPWVFGRPYTRRWNYMP